jgi:hypothetical protein
VRFSARAAFMLITNSNFVGCPMGQIARLRGLQDLVHVDKAAPERSKTSAPYWRSPLRSAKREIWDIVGSRCRRASRRAAFQAISRPVRTVFS